MVTYNNGLVRVEWSGHMHDSFVRAFKYLVIAKLDEHKKTEVNLFHSIARSHPM